MRRYLPPCSGGFSPVHMYVYSFLSTALSTAFIVSYIHTCAAFDIDCDCDVKIIQIIFNYSILLTVNVHLFVFTVFAFVLIMNFVPLHLHTPRHEFKSNYVFLVPVYFSL